MSDVYRGLDLARPDSTSERELEEFLGFGDQPGGRPLASFEFWARERPDVLKRSFAFTREVHAAESFTSTLPYLNLYAIGGWAEGVRYQFKLLAPGTFVSDVGFSRAAIVETLAVSFYLAPTWGTVEVAEAVRECLAAHPEPAAGSPSPLPPGWRAEPELLKAGLDSSTPDLTAADLRALNEWYQRVCGEAPAWLPLYAKYRPTLLKADRNRWENIVREGLPNQMFAYLFVHYEAWRGNLAALREALLLGRGLGMSREQAVDAIFYGGAFFGAAGTLAPIAEAVGELLESW